MEEAGDEPLFCERAAGIDIGKQVISVTVRVPSDTRRGGRQQEAREFGTTRRQLLAMADWLRCQSVVLQLSCSVPATSWLKHNPLDSLASSKIKCLSTLTPNQ